MTAQKYVLALLVLLLFGAGSMAQCLSLPDAFDQKLQLAEDILEGKVVSQESFFGDDGNIYTTNKIEVYRVLIGNAGLEHSIITEGGVVGNLMQIVTPSVKLKIGDYGVFTTSDDKASEFVSMNELSGLVYGNRLFQHRESVYEHMEGTVGSSWTELKRNPKDSYRTAEKSNQSAPELMSIYPSEVTAGTKTVLTISGSGFGATQGTGHVAFSNADDGGQSFVTVSMGPHYLSWSDTEIQLYVPSATLYNNTVAGSGTVQVVNNGGQVVESQQQITVNYAKSEVIYSQNLNRTMLVGMQNGGYEFSANQQLLDFLENEETVEESLVKWACNTGVNFALSQNVVSTTQWEHDDVNLIGLSESGQLPNYLLGKTITTFSGCGTPGGLSWNLIEVDIVLNRDINWYSGSGSPAPNQFDMATSILHELGHALLLQHNNNQSSPMYFELISGTSRRELHPETDIDGGNFIRHQAANVTHVCGEDVHVPFDNQECDLSLINSTLENESTEFSIYPNPFSDEFRFSLQDFQDATFRLYDSQGRIVLTESIIESNTMVSTSALSTGIYLLELDSGQARVTKRLVKN